MVKFLKILAIESIVCENPHHQHLYAVKDFKDLNLLKVLNKCDE